MGLFRDLGERVERFKQEVTDVAADEADYECRDCGELLYTERDECPTCEGDAVVPREPDAGDSSDDDEAGTPANEETTTDEHGSPQTGDDSTTDGEGRTGDASDDATGDVDRDATDS